LVARAVWACLVFAAMFAPSVNELRAEQSSADGPARAVEVVNAAQRSAVSIPDQARALARLAWPVEGEPDHGPLVREIARTRLIEFGQNGVAAVHETVRTRPAHSADALAAFVEIRAGYEVGLPPNYLVVFDDALWFGTREARRLAMQEIGAYGRVMNFLAIVDAAEEDPALTAVAIHTLGRLGNPRARFWLARQLSHQDADLRINAAMALASIGGEALDPLESGTRSGDPAFREMCLRALVPVAGPEQLTTLYEYLGTYEDSDPELADLVRERALALERAMDAWIESESASGGGTP
jgi:hypothetical protein